MPNYPADIGTTSCGREGPLLLIAGPCVLEEELGALQIAEHLAEVTEDLDVTLIFKASFDKANRSSGKSYRGPGLVKGLNILEQVRRVTGLEVTTDIHQPHQAAPVSEICNLLQIPAFLARQTDLLAAAAATGKAVNVKKAQFLAPSDMANVVTKLTTAGCHDILLTERGTFFGYGKLVNDFRSISQMQALGVPVVFDATHSVQEPGSRGETTGGNRAMVEPLARAAMALGVEGLFCETHPNPDQSPSDGPNMIPLAQMAGLLQRLLAIRKVINGLREISPDSPAN